MKSHVVLGIAVVVVIAFVAGYQLCSMDKSFRAEALSNQVNEPQQLQSNSVSEIEEKHFSNVADLQNYLNPLKMDHDFQYQYYGYPHYDKLDYAKWLVNKAKSDGYELDLQYELDDRLDITDIYCTYTLIDSNTVAYVNPETLNVEKKVHYSEPIDF